MKRKLVGELRGIYLDPVAWGKGLGGALLERATRELQAGGFRSATLWVLAANERAVRFYEAAGWSADGAQRHQTRFGVEQSETRYRLSLE